MSYKDVNKNLSYKDEKSNQNSILNKNFFKKEKEENTTCIFNYNKNKIFKL